jgi:LmbE family N-acetylglucosaminyl deacetylase
VACHPDDEVLGVGGTLLRHLDAGDDVTVLLDRECRPESTAESVEASLRMGIPYQWGLPPVEADVVYTHSLADLHADHRDLHERVLVACRPSAAPSVKAIYAFETPSATDWGMTPFRPTRFVDVTTTLARKLHAMEAYRSELREHPHPRNALSLADRAGYWGQVAGFASAEAFEVIRERW